MNFASQTGRNPPVRAKSRARASPECGGAAAVQPGMAMLELDWPAPNLWTPDQQAELKDRLLALSGRADLKYLILTGPDVFEGEPSRGRSLDHDDEATETIFSLIASLSLPIIAAIPGDATGSGLELAIACTARIARPDATLWLSQILSAQLPGPTALTRLPRMMGVKAATHMVALARSLDGRTAQSQGLLEVVTAGDLFQAVERLMIAAQTNAGGEQRTETADLQAQFYLARRSLRDTAPDQVAPVSAIRAMEACAQLRPRQAKAEVARIRDDLEGSPETPALRYAQGGLQSLGERAKGSRIDQQSLSLSLWWPLARETIHLLDEGASPAQVDRCFCAYGFPMGPFAKADAIGFAHVFTETGQGLASGEGWAHYSPTLDLMADSGRIGGASPGWYASPSEDSASRFDTFVDRLIQNSSISQRLRRQVFSDEAVMERCLGAGINASFAALQAHPVLTACEIDAIWFSHLGFPRWKGGVIYQARLRGLDAVIAGLRASCARMTAGVPCDLLLSSAAECDMARAIKAAGGLRTQALSA